MDRRKLPELAIAYVKIGTTLLCTWPLTSGATNLQRKFNQVKWLSLLLLLCSLEFSILYTAYLSRANFMELTRFICFAASSGHAIIKMIVCRWHQQEYRELIEEMEIFLTYATCREREVLDVCVRKAAPVHLTFNIIGLVAGISYICGPIILDQNLPTETVYPFATDHYPALQIIYLMQSISVLQCCTVGPLDGQVCMPFWFNIARLKLLASDMRKISGVDDLNACIKVHQDILRFTQKAIKVTRPMVMTTVAMATISVVFGAVHVIGNEPLEVKAQFVGLNVGYGLELYLSAWAAENFMKAVIIQMENVKWAIYDSCWTQGPRRTTRSLIIVLQKLNRIPKISVGGFIPELSLNYYALYLSKTMSFFTTLHIMLQKMEESVEETRFNDSQ